ncbi:MAG: hypothetical protein QXW18_06765 [Candidatus Bathyarchaeia archaeon]
MVGSNLYDTNDLAFTGSAYELTAKTRTASTSVITDKICIDPIGVVDERIYVNTEGAPQRLYEHKHLAYAPGRQNRRKLVTLNIRPFILTFLF